jgi:quercetin dioxygenase-like cupin family protein
MRVLPTACALILLTAPAFASGSPGIAMAPVMQTRTTDTGQTLDVPAHPTVIVSQTTMAPGARTPTHKHPYPRYVYVIEGTLTVVDEATGQTFEVKQGGFLTEMIDTWHHGENRGKSPVRLIAIDQVPEGTATNTVAKSEQ